MSILGELVWGEGSAWAVIRNALGWETEELKALKIIEKASEKDTADVACNSLYKEHTVVQRVCDQLIDRAKRNPDLAVVWIIDEERRFVESSVAQPEMHYCFKFGNLHKLFDLLRERSETRKASGFTGEKSVAFFESMKDEYAQFLARKPVNERTMDNLYKPNPFLNADIDD